MNPGAQLVLGFAAFVSIISLIGWLVEALVTEHATTRGRLR